MLRDVRARARRGARPRVGWSRASRRFAAIARGLGAEPVIEAGIGATPPAVALAQAEAARRGARVFLTVPGTCRACGRGAPATGGRAGEGAPAFVPLALDSAPRGRAGTARRDDADVRRPRFAHHWRRRGRAASPPTSSSCVVSGSTSTRRGSDRAAGGTAPPKPPRLLSTWRQLASRVRPGVSGQLALSQLTLVKPASRPPLQ